MASAETSRTRPPPPATEPARILIADDEPAARVGLRRALGKAYGVIEAADGREALRLIDAERPDLVILDLNMPVMTGFQVLEALQERDAAPRVIVLTAYGSERIAIEAMKKGACDYLAKPYEVDELRLVVARELQTHRLVEENERLRRAIETPDGFGELIGRSEPMRAVYDVIERVSDLDVTVLIQGESGTGKDVVARELHARSGRRDAPFVAVNCAALPDTLIESELFGHRKGAFTGATSDRKGKFETADTGTLFLDEIGDMSASVQAKLLRVLETKTVEPLGNPEPVAVDVRVISASHQDLVEATRTGDFREDLYYRLKVVDVTLPPLRARRDDVPLLAAAFLERFAAKHDRPRLELSPEALARLTDHAWPGNVRELRNVIEKAFVLATGDRIEPRDLPPEVADAPPAPRRGVEEVVGLPFQAAKKEVLRAFETEFIERKLRDHDGNISRTAGALGMARQSLQQKLKELGINVNRFREG